MLGRLRGFFGKRSVGIGSAEHEAILAELDPDDVAVDCGANVGHITALMAKNGAEVHCFEPNPFAYEKLAQRFSGNERVHCYQAAVAASDGHATLYLHERADENQVQWSTGSSLDPRKKNVSSSGGVEVATINLARFLQELGRPVRVLKMDIEGAELQVLPPLITSGALDCIQWVLVELHDAKNTELRNQTTELRKLVTARKMNNIRFDWK